MRIAHRHPGNNWFAVPESDPVDDDYEAHVQRVTEHAEREYQKARERLARAEQRLAKAITEKARSGRKAHMAKLRVLVEERRAELATIERLMTTPAVTADKQIMLRTGLDDHLELGEYKRERSKRVPAGPVVVRKVDAA